MFSQPLCLHRHPALRGHRADRGDHLEYLAGALLGIGRFTLLAADGSGRMDLVLAATVVAGAFGYLINEGLERLGRWWFRWSTVVREAK